MKMDTMYYASPVKRKVLGDINNTAESPISPTANLKLLTKVASECDSIENRNTNVSNLYPITGIARTPPNMNLNPPGSQNLKHTLQVKGVRKFKSLGFLCDKFLKLYPLDIPENKHSEILLSNLANQLGVEKRRVYDIINVVESLQMASKIGKNSYSWTGHKKLADTLSQLRACAEQVGLVQFVRTQQFNRKLYINLHDGEIENTESLFVENSNIASFFRNERRIGVLCQKFMMLFLVSLKEGVVNLDLAAHVLVGDDCQQNKTRLRRLYDIANILVSLGIITKLDLPVGWKKPVFRYVGPPLHHLEISSESSILSNLVNTDLSDGISSDMSDVCNGSFVVPSNFVKTELCDVTSDMSEDSSESLWKPQQTSCNPFPVPDHSYSLDSTKIIEKPVAVVEPAAKKRLIFSDPIKNILPQRKSFQVTPVRVMPTMPTVVRVLGHGGNIPQPITNGAVYKAVRVGNDIQLIRIDSC